MAIEVVREYLKQWGADKRIIEFPTSSATVELAAQAAGCEPARIAKTLSFLVDDHAILIVMAGEIQGSVPHESKDVERGAGDGAGGSCGRRRLPVRREGRRGGLSGRVAETLRDRFPGGRELEQRDRSGTRRAGEVLRKLKMGGRE